METEIRGRWPGWSCRAVALLAVIGVVSLPMREAAQAQEPAQIEIHPPASASMSVVDTARLCADPASQLACVAQFTGILDGLSYEQALVRKHLGRGETFCLPADPLPVILPEFLALAKLHPELGPQTPSSVVMGILKLDYPCRGRSR